MVCSNCHAVNPDGGQACVSCGAILDQSVVAGVPSLVSPQLAVPGKAKRFKRLSFASVAIILITLFSLTVVPAIKLIQNLTVKDDFKIQNINSDGIRTWALTKSGNLFRWGYRISDKPSVIAGVKLGNGVDIKKWGLNYDSDLADYLITTDGKMYGWNNVSFGGTSISKGGSYKSKPTLFKGLGDQFISDGGISSRTGWALNDSGDLFVWGSARTVTSEGVVSFAPRKINQLFGNEKVLRASISDNNAFVLTKDDLYTWRKLDDGFWKASDLQKSTIKDISYSGGNWYAIGDIFVSTADGQQYIVEVSSFLDKDGDSVVGNRVMNIHTTESVSRVYFDQTGFRNSLFLITPSGTLYTYNSKLKPLGIPDENITNDMAELTLTPQNELFNNEPIDEVVSSNEGQASTICAKTTVGNAYCWDRWDGKSSANSLKSPKKIVNGAIEGNVKDITATVGCVFVTLQSGDLYAAGWNSSGQCGVGNKKESYNFQRVLR